MSRQGSTFKFIDGYAETDTFDKTFLHYYDTAELRDYVHNRVTVEKLKHYIQWWTQCERVLKALTPHERRKHFNMEDFGYKSECGTVACAAGYCGLDPWFRRRGFAMKWDEYYEVFDKPENVEASFGEDGSNAIFYDTRKRPVSAVIKEVQAHITALKAQLEDRKKWTQGRRSPAPVLPQPKPKNKPPQIGLGD